MSDIDLPAITDTLWHSMRADFVSFAPDHSTSTLLMCPACGRLLPRAAFSLDHLIPQQVLADDPPEVRSDPATPKNVRAGLLLLCKQPLRYKGRDFYQNGCNSWKGRHYDPAIRRLVTGKALTPKGFSQTDLIAALNLAYLAMVSEFGYRVVLMKSGLMMRQQFFNPVHFHPQMPIMCQVVLGSSEPVSDLHAPAWKKPFSFTVRDGKCAVGIRNFVALAPLSADPTQPTAKHLRIAPPRYRTKPDFRAVLD